MAGHINEIYSTTSSPVSTVLGWVYRFDMELTTQANSIKHTDHSFMAGAMNTDDMGKPACSGTQHALCLIVYWPCKSRVKG